MLRYLANFQAGSGLNIASARGRASYRLRRCLEGPVGAAPPPRMVGPGPILQERALPATDVRPGGGSPTSLFDVLEEPVGAAPPPRMVGPANPVAVP